MINYSIDPAAKQIKIQNRYWWDTNRSEINQWLCRSVEHNVPSSDCIAFRSRQELNWFTMKWRAIS